MRRGLCTAVPTWKAPIALREEHCTGNSKASPRQRGRARRAAESRRRAPLLPLWADARLNLQPKSCLPRRVPVFTRSCDRGPHSLNAPESALLAAERAQLLATGVARALMSWVRHEGTTRLAEGFRAPARSVVGLLPLSALGRIAQQRAASCPPGGADSLKRHLAGGEFATGAATWLSSGARARCRSPRHHQSMPSSRLTLPTPRGELPLPRCSSDSHCFI